MNLVHFCFCGDWAVRAVLFGVFFHIFLGKTNTKLEFVYIIVFALKSE